MTSAGGPWTVFQKRFDGSVSFYRSWLTYRHGFGTANGEYWLGLENIHLLTMKKSYRLKIVLKDWQNKVGFVTYDKFSISRLAINANKNGYQLSIGAFKEGDRSNPLGDSLTYHNGMKFTTYDRDLDQYNSNCAMKYYGAFWYKDCHGANLNGEYLQGNTTQYGMGIVWGSGKGYYYSYKGTMMMIGPSA
ncbi:microfibril-associated glycoprotein 4-like [Hyperolius riggenbachi]|uniref:microfibril-associated glycoprotein 4-like n=1 Tax=Hyperolius riggenbachi TaxID=752182 RepID=UPI0035A2BC1C